MTNDRYRVGVIGDPVAHSISPAMQQPALDALGIPATFELWHTPAAELPARIASLRGGDVFGANVTVPHKRAVMEHIDEISPLARRAGAVNVVVNRDGHLSGDNTDVHGFAVSLEEVCPNARVRPALVLGAGGAARAVVLALEALGLPWIALANRNVERAKALADDLAPTPLHVIATDERSLAVELRRAAILVNATSLGWHRGETPLRLELLELLPRNALVADLTYRDTDLLVAARERGLATLDGLAMLVYQGAKALQLWTGRDAPVAVMMEAAQRARAARA
jgi:shikimate dehydrogenase